MLEIGMKKNRQSTVCQHGSCIVPLRRRDSKFLPQPSGIHSRSWVLWAMPKNPRGRKVRITRMTV